MARHINIPIFIPHLGCPNQCVFCNQRLISGTYEFSESKVRENIDSALSTVPEGCECEIAFFGGSFTGIDKALMIRLLTIAKGYVDRGVVSSIRCSTRPDYIDESILSILGEYGVKTVELGLQSVSESVLKITKRGHGIEAAKRAARLIVEGGFTLGGQMMIGLPGASPEDEIKTARFIAESGAGEARIYPTVVFFGTELCDMTRAGEYTPLSVEEAVGRSAAALRILLDAGVKVLRIGLCDSENLHADESYFAGPNHPAMGELVLSELYYEIMSDGLLEIENLKDKSVIISVGTGHLSKAIGQKRGNYLRIMERFKPGSLKFKENPFLQPYKVGIEVNERI